MVMSLPLTLRYFHVPVSQMEMVRAQRMEALEALTVHQEELERDESQVRHK